LSVCAITRYEVSMHHRESLRLESFGSMDEAIVLLADGNAGSAVALKQAALLSGVKWVAFLTTVDSKHLYGAEIYKVYMYTCGGDLKEFLRFVEKDLPCQI